MKNSLYKRRIIDSKIDLYLETFGAVCIEGPKWCGKTWTSSFHSKSQIFLGDPAGNFQNRALAELSSQIVLQGDQPRLLDEWQEVPALWDAVRFEVDKNSQKGQFILTGSATPNHKGILHSGAGRIARLRMRPMSLIETGISSGKVSLQELCMGHLNPILTGDVELMQIIECIVRGGWPANQEVSIDKVHFMAKEYLDVILTDDVYRLDGVQRDRKKMELLLRSLARNESTTVTNKKIRDDIKEVDDENLVVETIASYLDVLNRLFLIDNQKPFSHNIRSRVRVKQAEKRHLSDPSLACALLKATPEILLKDLNTLGLLFESLCERDLKIYAESFGAELFHYQDYNNREIDAVISLPDGDWCAFEIKLGANQIEEAAKKLIKLKKEMEQEQDSIPPKILGIICGLSNAAYQRPDGVYVVPITALAP